MVSSGFAAFGTTLIWNNVPVLELTNLTPGLGTVDDIEITNHDSADATEEFVPGLLRSDSFGFEGNLLPTDTNGQVAFLTDMQSRTARAAYIHLPNGKGTFSFSAYAKEFRPTMPVTGKASLSASMKVNGKTSFYSTAATGLTTPFLAARDNGANAVTLSPTAAGDTYQYKGTLDYADTAVAICPTASSGTIYVNGTAVTTGNYSSDIAVTAGTTKLIIVETRETSKASKIYRIYITRPSS